MYLRGYLIKVFFAAFNIFIFEAQVPVAENKMITQNEEKIIREYVHFVNENADDFSVLTGSGFIYAEDTEKPIGAFDINYYYQEEESGFAEDENLVMIEYEGIKNGITNKKTFLFDSQNLSYYREVISEHEEGAKNSLIEIFFKRGNLNNYYVKDTSFVLDIENYVEKIKKDIRNDDFHDSFVDFYKYTNIIKAAN